MNSVPKSESAGGTKFKKGETQFIGEAFHSERSGLAHPRTSLNKRQIHTLLEFILVIV